MISSVLVLHLSLPQRAQSAYECVPASSITGLLSNDVPEWNIRSPGTPLSHPGMQSDFAQEIPSPLPPRRGGFSEAYPGPKEEEN